MSDELSDEEKFFTVHGVGEYTVPKENKDIDYLIDKTKPTFNEREFVRHMLLGNSQVESYIRAYDKAGEMARSTATYMASKLIKRKRVKAYYYELMEERDKLAEESLPKLMAELNEDRKLARDLGQPSAAIAAVKAKANMLGLENRPDTNNVTLNIMADDVKDKLLDRIAQKHIDAKEKSQRGQIIDADFSDMKDITPDE